MARFGLTGYRFSIAWPRVMPSGRGTVNQRGLDFYDRLVDGLLAAGIKPYPTLYHWDLPQALEDEGGWAVRSTAVAFADYAEVVIDRLADRVGDWMTMNEPFVIANHGYLTGEHAPGRQSLARQPGGQPPRAAGTRLGVGTDPRLRAGGRAGIVLNFTPVTPVGTSPAAIDRQRMIDDLENRWYVEPVAGHGYPGVHGRTARLGRRPRCCRRSGPDRRRRSTRSGVNFYTRQNVGAVNGERLEPVEAETAMGWEVHPASLGTLLHELHHRYKFGRYLITENGAAMPDHHRLDGRIIDADRIDYFAAHLGEVHRAIEAGVPIEGYFAWSLLDNFEWAHGYGPCFGIVEVDFETQRRIPKQSALWYAQVAKAGEILPWNPS